MDEDHDAPTPPDVRFTFTNERKAFVLIVAGTGLTGWSAGFWIARRLASRRESLALGVGTPWLVTADTALVASGSFVAAIFAAP